MRLVTTRSLTEDLIAAIEKKWEGALSGRNRPTHPAHICVRNTYEAICKVRNDYQAVNKLLASASYVWETELGKRYPQLPAPKPHPVNPFQGWRIEQPKCDLCGKLVNSVVVVDEIAADSYNEERIWVCGECILHALKVHDGEAQS